VNRFVKRLGIATASALLALVTSTIAAPPAYAGGAHGCPYPYVCVYSEQGLGGSIVARFQVVTSSPQSLDNPQRGWSIFNTRNDDIVYTWSRDSDPDGTWERFDACTNPNGTAGSNLTLREIRIDSRSRC
jgi:hypothetical protein